MGVVQAELRSANSFTLGLNFENLTFDSLNGIFRKDVHGIGNLAANVIVGGGGSDMLEGRAGNDTLAGREGHDTLVGGFGHDTFAFGYTPQTAALNSGGFEPLAAGSADTVNDFVSGVDRFSLASGAFDFMHSHTGGLKAAQFGLVGSVLTGHELVLYDQATGDLSSTGHGGGPGGSTAVVFAHVTPGMVLTFHDFEWFNL